MTAPTPCPSFSWGLRGRASGYRLVVYQLDPASTGSPEALPVVVEKELPPGTTVWSPALDECLVPGGAYAWAVAAVEGSAVEWSQVASFRVAPEEELRALWAAQVPGAPAASASRTGGAAAAESTPAEEEEEEARSTSRRRGTPARRAATAPIVALSAPKLVVEDGIEVVGGDTPRLRLDQDTSGGFAAHSWEISANEKRLDIHDATAGTSPLTILAGAPSTSLFLDGAGNLGLGKMPVVKLDVSGSVAATSFSGSGAGLTGVTASGLVCSSCVQASDLAPGSVGASEIATGAVGESELATNSVRAAEIAGWGVGGLELSPRRLVRVECGADCSDVSLYAVCQQSTTGDLPIALACVSVSDAGSVDSYTCGTDNTCRRATLTNSTPLGLCNAVTGYDAVVTCLSPGS